MFSVLSLRTLLAKPSLVRFARKEKLRTCNLNPTITYAASFGMTKATRSPATAARLGVPGATPALASGRHLGSPEVIRLSCPALIRLNTLSWRTSSRPVHQPEVGFILHKNSFLSLSGRLNSDWSLVSFSEVVLRRSSLLVNRLPHPVVKRLLNDLLDAKNRVSVSHWLNLKLKLRFR